MPAPPPHVMGGPVQRKVAYQGSKVASPGDFTISATWSQLAEELTEVVRAYLSSLDPETLRVNPEPAEAARAVLNGSRGPGMIIGG